MFLVFLLLGSALAEDVRLEAGQIFKFTTPDYPNGRDEDGSLNYNLVTSANAKVYVYCEDFRTMGRPNEECDFFALTLDDGVKTAKFCKHEPNLHFISTGPTLRIGMKFISRQLVSCLARSTEEPIPQIVELTPQNKHFKIESNDPLPYLDQVWLIKGTNGEQIDFECRFGFRPTPTCYSERYLIDNGSENKVGCGSEYVKVTSTHGQVKFRVVLDQYGYSRYYCDATLQIKKSGNNQPEPPAPQPDVDIEPTPPPLTKKEINVELHKGDFYEFKSPGYPYGIEGENTNTLYHFSTSPNSKIQVYCKDIRIFGGSESPCDTVEVSFDDGTKKEKICKSESQHFYVSNVHKATVGLKFRVRSAVDCVARTTEEPKPTIAHLDPYERPYKFAKKEEELPYGDLLWELHSKEGSRVSLQCGISFERGDPCMQDMFTIDNGNEVKTYCGGMDIVEFSAGQKIKVRAQLNSFGHERFNCIAQAVTGPNADQHKNLKSAEIDSSEHGTTQGKVPTTCDCGRRNHDGARIFNGKETKVGEYTWMVAIRDHSNFQRCGGSLITKNHVLTAAHCMVDNNVRNKNQIWETVVVLGSHDVRKDPAHGGIQRIEVPDQNVYIPDEWWNFKKNYDIAVLVLPKPATFSKWVGPVCMTNIAPHIFNKEVKITGWGTTEKMEASPVLKTTKLFVLYNEICNMAPWFVCTRKSHTATCSGDSGSPFVHLDEDTNRYTQVSLVSFGTSAGVCTNEKATGSTNTTFFYDWIDGIVKKTVPTVNLCTKV